LAYVFNPQMMWSSSSGRDFQGTSSPNGEAIRTTPNGLPDARTLIVSNRLPITVRVDGDETRIESSVGGLATGLRRVHERAGNLWIGWPGPIWRLDATQRRDVEVQLRDHRVVPVTLLPQQVEVFYEHLSNGVLWPVLHDRLDRLPLRLDGWDVYEEVNQAFADVVASQWRPGDMIWIHDYQLMRLPALLRARIPKARIGFFLHVPFPNPEMYLTLPVREWLLDGVLAADLIGFHTRRYRGHFTAVIRRLKHLEMDADGFLRFDRRAVQLGIYPMGVDAADLAERANARSVTSSVLELKSSHLKLLAGVDRLDYSKGLVRRLAAFERLLELHPEWCGKIRLVQVAVPSRENTPSYQDHRAEFEAAVGRINGRFGTAGWTPIHYIYRPVDDDTLLALYRAADVMLVTPLRDGMNLVAKEFVACRSTEDGVLVLSEFAGAADELQEASIVNPYDVDGVARAIHEALVMDGSERRRRMRALRERVSRSDVHVWAQSFLESLAVAAVR
jgi:trehalose 6-phosphate synthase/phosphatase